MAFGSLGGSSNAPMSEINMTPLVDVMLVLLIIFIVTAPLMSQAIKVDLPRTHGGSITPKPETLRVSLDTAGQFFLNDAPVSDDILAQRFALAAALAPQPELHLSADKETSYQHVAKVMGAARKAGITKLGFVTRPARE